MMADVGVTDAARAGRHGHAAERAVVSGRVALEASVLRLRSLEALDVALALATSGRERDYATWSRRVVAGVGADPIVGAEGDPQWAATLAQILARSTPDASAEAVALAIYRETAARFGLVSLEPRDAQVYGQLLLQSGHHEELRAVLPHLELRPVIRRMLLADLEREAVVAGQRPMAAWYGAMQELMQVGSLGFELPHHSEAFRFDALRSKVDGEPVDGPLISVVMPVFAPDAGLVTAVRSILDQTWQHLEVLVVDDASPSETRHVFGEVAALDERVRIISRPRNGGTYAARNTALAAARGDFITGQDADDWSHPERLERQVRPLLGDGSLVATLSRCLRVTDDFRASSLRASGSSPTRMNSSSLMFRRTEVMHRMGYYDLVRKGADSEFIFRMRATFGKPAVRELPDCLALVRLVTGSLSRSDFLPGWQHESRVWYRELYTHWHREIRRGDDPFLALERGARPFPAPASFVSKDAGLLELDDLLVADLRYLQTEQQRLLATARRLAAQGRRVAVAHLERFDTLEPVRRNLHPAIVDALCEGEFALAEWSREVAAEHVVFWPAELVEFHGERQARWRAGRVSLVVEESLPLASLPASLLRWQAAASWVASNVGVEDGIDVVALPDRGAAGERQPEEQLPLQPVGSFGPSFDHREIVLAVESMDQGSPPPQLTSVVEACAERGIRLRIVDACVVGGPTDTDDRSAEPGVPEAGEHGLSALVTLAAGQRGTQDPVSARVARWARGHVFVLQLDRDDNSAESVRFLPSVQSDAGTRSSSHRADPSPHVPRQLRRDGVREAGPHPLAFVAVAEGLGFAEAPGWSSHVVDGVQYWFPVEGTAVVVASATLQRLRAPSCMVAICRGDGDVSGPAGEWSRFGTEDASRALTTLSSSRAWAALAMHDGHHWTVHSTAPTAVTYARDQAGHICAVATDEQVLASFVSTLRGSDVVGCPDHQEGNVRRLLRAGRHPVGSGWSRGTAVAFSTLHGYAFTPLAELASARRL